MILTLADGSRHVECQHSARSWETGRTAEDTESKGRTVGATGEATDKILATPREVVLRADAGVSRIYYCYLVTWHTRPLA